MKISIEEGFVNWVNDNYCCDFDIDEVVETSEPPENFYKALIECHSKDSDEFEGMPVMVLERTQRFKGEQRQDLYILDLGTHSIILSC